MKRCRYGRLYIIRINVDILAQELDSGRTDAAFFLFLSALSVMMKVSKRRSEVSQARRAIN